MDAPVLRRPRRFAQELKRGPEFADDFAVVSYEDSPESGLVHLAAELRHRFSICALEVSCER
jgi:hypothetical protein